MRRLGTEVYARLLDEHHRIVREALGAHDGAEQGAEGDAFFATFTSPNACIECAIEAQRSLRGQSWPESEDVRVRMGIHTGEATITPTGLVGYDVHRAARIGAVAHGGQVLVSSATSVLLEDALPPTVGLLDLGTHRLKDLGRPERLFQVVAPGLATEFPPLASLDNPKLRNNLPIQLTSFVGRESELDAISKLLSSTRLVTLTGAGGCGKTRLALQAAANDVDGSGGGVWFVDLAQLRDERFVDAAVASALGLRSEPGTLVVDTISTWIRDEAVLIVLDNCEHLVDASAKLVDRLLHACPNLVILATSREPLGIDGEHVYRVPSLAMPYDADTSSSSSLLSCEAVQLLVERAKSHDALFELEDDSARAIASICRRLDGIPLAIELVAQRVAAMSPSEVERRLDDRFKLLTGGSRTALARQQTLLASIDWSFELLTVAQQAVLARASTFVGSFDLEAAEAVCTSIDVAEAEVSSLVASLVDRSLVRIEREAGSHRYKLGETIREYAAQKLRELDPTALAMARTRHAEHYCERLQRRDHPPQFTYFRQESAIQSQEWRRFPTQDGPNYVAALIYDLDSGADSDEILRLAYGASCALQEEHRYAECVDLTEQALACTTASGSPFLVAIAEFELGSGLVQLARFDEGRAALERAKSSAALAGRLDLVLRVNWNLTFIAYRRGDPAARDLVCEGISVAESAGDPDLIAYARKCRGSMPDYFDGVQCLNDLEFARTHFHRRGFELYWLDASDDLAMTELEMEDFASAREHLTMVLQHGGVTGRMVFVGYLNLAQIELALGNIESARQHWTAGASAIESGRYAAYYLPCVLIGAMCCVASDRHSEAAVLFDAADALAQAADERLEPYEAKRRDVDLATLNDSLGEATVKEFQAKGAGMTFFQAMAFTHKALSNEH